MSENPIEILAKLRSSLEKEIENLEDKIFELKAYTRAIDHFLIKSSIKTADKIKPKDSNKEESKIIFGNDNNKLGEIKISQNKIIFIPDSKISINVQAPSFKSFFITKILDKLKEEDEISIREGNLDAANSFNYLIEDKDSIIKKLIIENYRTTTRLNNIEKTLRWALEKAMN